jgi:hypothetical protein
MTATGNRGEVGFGDRDRALKQTFVPPLAVRRHPLLLVATVISTIEIVVGDHLPDLPFVIVDRQAATSI